MIYKLYINLIINPLNTNNNIIGNQEIILNNLKKTYGGINSFTQIRMPNLNNLEFESLNFTPKYMSTNTELQLFKYLKDTCLERIMERSVDYKKRKNYLIIQYPSENVIL